MAIGLAGLAVTVAMFVLAVVFRGGQIVQSIHDLRVSNDEAHQALEDRIGRYVADDKKAHDELAAKIDSLSKEITGHAQQIGQLQGSHHE